MHKFVYSKRHALILKTPYFSSFPHLDFSQAPEEHHFTSESTSLNVPCNFAPYVSWEHLKARGVQIIYWQFTPKQLLSSGDDPQKLYFLSEDNMQAWNNTGRKRELKPVQDLHRGNLSLNKKRGTKEDEGKYTCIVKFKDGTTLHRTIFVEMLQSKSKQIGTILAQLCYIHTFE